KEFQAAVKAKNGDKAWALLSKESQMKMELVVGLMKEQFKKLDDLPEEKRKEIEELISKKLGMPLADLKKMDGKKFFGFALKNAEKFAGPGGDGLKELHEATLEDLKVEGDKATAKVKTSKKSDPIHFIKEGGSWKVTMPAK